MIFSFSPVSLSPHFVTCVKMWVHCIFCVERSCKECKQPKLVIKEVVGTRNFRAILNESWVRREEPTHSAERQEGRSLQKSQIKTKARWFSSMKFITHYCFIWEACVALESGTMDNLISFIKIFWGIIWQSCNTPNNKKNSFLVHSMASN